MELVTLQVENNIFTLKLEVIVGIVTFFQVLSPSSGILDSSCLRFSQTNAVNILMSIHVKTVEGPYPAVFVV
jgi:hypothetical protein